MHCRFLPPLVILNLVQSALATNGTWNNPGNAGWSAAANWAGGVIAGNTDSAVDFSALDIPGDVTVTLDGVRTAGSLAFGDLTPDHDWFLRGVPGSGLTLDVVTGVPLVTVKNKTATLGAELKGNDGLAKDGAGTLVLAAANTYSGPTLINQGTLRLGRPASFPSGMRVMPLGDSITYGFDGSNAGYRGPLYQLLTPVAANFQFVGTSVERPGQLPLSPIDQRHNEGHASYTIQDISNNLDGFDNSRYLQLGGPERNPNGGYWLTGGNGTGRGPMMPDIVTLMIGTNDLLDFDGIDARLGNLITKIVTLRPDARVLVAKITPNTLFPAQAASYDTVIENVVNGFQAVGKQVFLVDMKSGFPAAGLTSDGVHPNDVGFNWMAREWHEAITAACTPGSGTTPSIPSSSPVTIAQGATLELAGNQATTGTITNSGVLDLGQGGAITTFSFKNQATGQIRGSGTINATFNHSGTSLGNPGGNLTFTGAVINNGTIDTTTGASLHFSQSGALINNGTLIIGPAQITEFSGDVTNNSGGVIRVVGGATLQGAGKLTNNGLLDLITGMRAATMNVENHGIVLDSSLVKVRSTALDQSSIILTIDSYTGHSYQLQSSEDLATGGWSTVSTPFTGLTGSVLTFTAPRDASKGRAFYRISVFP